MTGLEVIEIGLVGGVVQAIVILTLAKLGLFPAVAIIIRDKQ